jgi:hypothetical protein
MKKLAITLSLIACATPGLAAASALPLAKSSSTSAAGLPGIQVETSLSRPGSGSTPTRTTVNEGLPGLATVSYTAQNFGTGHAASDALRINLGSTPPSLGADLDTVVFSPLVLNPNVTAILPGIGSAGPQHIFTLFDDALLGALAVGAENHGSGKVFTLTASYFSPTL